MILRVAIDAPLLQLFDYLPPASGDARPGCRVRVPFGRGQRVGLVVAIAAESTLPSGKLRRAFALLDAAPLLDAEMLALLEWAAGYYQHPPGEVYATALPVLLRAGRTTDAGALIWRITTDGREALLAGEPRRAPAQRRVLESLGAAAAGLGSAALARLSATWPAAVRALEGRGWVRREREDGWVSEPVAADRPPALNPAQAAAVQDIAAARGFQPFLVQGITGSGKTEVYLHAIAAALAAGRQSLVLVPEIGLTPQLVARFRRRFPDTGIVVLHSGLTDTERLTAWLRARDGRAGIVIGTRSAIFTPLQQAGLIVVDEEHDGSFKQQEGFRYSARDLAVWRARQLGVPILLGSATPSLESLANAEAGRYRRLRLPERAGSAKPPAVQLVDLRRQIATDGLSPPLVAAIGRHLDAGGQVLLYLNRRGFAPTLLCTDCGKCLECTRCDARLVLHLRERRLTCHHCDAMRPIPDHCPHCQGPLYPVGQGTERLESALAALFPNHPLLRIDRDTTRARGEIERRLAAVAAGEARILLGTQMLTKGHDFPLVTLVGIVDADQGLFGADFRASERLAQTFVQVAGRAGRSERAGEVVLQTLFPDHPLLRLLVSEGYERFAAAALAERRAAGWPPYSHLALLRADATTRNGALDFLAAARTLAESLESMGVRLLGPAPAPMEKRGGRYRAQLVAESSDRARLQQFIGRWRPALEQLAGARRNRWSLDVDPVELY
ncbi:MAG: primosomal protein N' [Gammaproteobacteria bacterium]|nr:primosomal protein N' [Gammaproteobacteria bacterium]